MNLFSYIVCLPDLLRLSRATSDGMFDLVREPIRQACGARIGHAPGGKRPQGLLPGFDLAHFRALAQQGQPLSAEALWARTYHGMPAAAVAYLLGHLPPQPLLLSVDMPPWLRSACTAAGLAFLDLRQSPLRFGRDLFIALDTQHPQLRARLALLAISDEELHLEAAVLGANLRAHHRHLQESKRHRFDLDGSLIFASQPSDDSALLASDGQLLQAGRFAEQLSFLAAQRSLLCTVDYSDETRTRTDEQTRTALSALLGQPVRACPQNPYQLLSTEDDVAFVGISAPLLQEAPWFDKTAHSLATPATPLAGSQAPSTCGYLQVHFQDMLSPAFWHQMLAPDAPAPRLARLQPLDRHHGRETLDAWGDYEKVLNWERPLAWWAFERSGGIVQHRRISALEQNLATAAPASGVRPAAAPSDSMQARIQRLHNTKVGQTAYVLGNAPSLNTLDIAALMARETFWCNRAFELESQGHTFRPRYYFMRDSINFQTWADKVIGLDAGIKVLGKEAYSLVEKLYPKALRTQDIISLEVSQTPGNCMFDSEFHFSQDPSLMVYSGYTVVLDAIQLAFYMGYSQVLVGGVELDYSQPYFHGGTHSRRQEEMDRLTDHMRQSFPVARKHFERHGRVLAKITPSPHLPLDFVEAPDVRRAPNPLA